MAKYLCNLCDYVYNEAKGDEDSGIKAGTLWKDIPNDWTCPICGVTKSDESAWELIK